MWFMWWTGPGTVVDAFLWRNRLLMKVNDFIPDPGCQLNFILWFREGSPQSSTPPSSKSLDIYQTKPIYWLKDHCLGSKVIPRIDRWIDLMMFEAFGLFLISILGFWTLHYSQICWNAGAQNDTKCTCAFCFLHTQLYPEKPPKKPWNTHTHTMFATPLRPEDFISKAEWRDNRGVKSPAHCQRACTWNTACEARIFGWKFYDWKINHRAFEVCFLLDSGSTMH